jgi:hypothetical protein
VLRRLPQSQADVRDRSARDRIDTGIGCDNARVPTLMLLRNMDASR